MKTTLLIAMIALLMASMAKADCVSEMAYHEARSESLLGQIAVVNVAYNRAKKSGKPVCKEIHRKKQFSFFNRGFVPAMKDKEALRVASMAAFIGQYVDVTGGANHYNRRELGLRKGAKNKRVIDSHVFYRI